MPTCKVSACENKIYGLGFCRRHYLRNRRHGDPLAGQTTPGAPQQWLKDNLPRATPDACLLWPFGAAKGYGKIRHDGRARQVNNFVCEQAHGPAPADRQQAAHSCGVSACVNPHHLRWASAQENADDMILHGTRRVGDTHQRARLSAEAVSTIRANPDGLSHAQLAVRYNVSKSNITAIRTQKTWRHL
jgi:hypothetical protein